MGASTTDRLPGLHALRVVAAVSVFAGHAIFWGRDWMDLRSVLFIAGSLALGLQLFFVVSAFSLMHSTRIYASAPDWVTRFYGKRFWRIAPLFYFMMLMDGLFSHHFFKHDTSLVEVGLDALFINNFFPHYASSIVFAGWSVSVEMMFYVFFPLIFANVKTVRTGAVVALVGIIASQVSKIYFDRIPQDIGNYGDFALPVLFQYFWMGVLAYLVYDRLKRTRMGAPAPWRVTLIYHGMFVAVAAVLVAILVFFHRELAALKGTDLTLWGLLFALFAVWWSLLRIPVLNWAPIQYFGERSYSLYLLHIPLIFLLKPLTVFVFDIFDNWLGVLAIVPAMAATYVPIMAASAVTYAFIEKPGMDFERRLRMRSNAQRAAQASVNA